jgi:hypothetical protein
LGISLALFGSQARGSSLTTKLEGPLKRELLIDGQQYTLTVSPAGFLLAPKGRRKGLQLAWADLVSGEAALATALNASLTAGAAPRKASPASGTVASTDRGPKARGGKRNSGK